MQNPESKEKIAIVSDALPEDAEGITTVLYQTWLDTYPNEEVGITREDVEDSYRDSFTPEKISAMAEGIRNLSDNKKRVVAKIDGRVVGMATMSILEEYNQLRTIYVLPEFQGQGVGKKLWQEVKNFTDPKKDIVVHVADYNKKTIEFYKKLGFVDTGKRWQDDRWKMKSGAMIPEMEMVIKAEE